MKTATRETRYGRMTFFDGTDFVGTSLATYGEYSQDEVNAILSCLKPDRTKIAEDGSFVAIEVGANIGAITLPMAFALAQISPKAKLLAFEPCKEAFRLLEENLTVNAVANVLTYPQAASDHAGTLNCRNADVGLGCILTGEGDQGIVECLKIDDLELDHVWFVKIDVDGHELQVLRGARDTIKRCKPIIYIENDRQEKSVAVIAELTDLGYRLFWHKPPLFNPNNFNGEKKNLFGPIVSMMMCCFHEDSGIKLDGCDEVADIRDDDLMFARELDRYNRYVEHNPDDLDSRLMVAHLYNLMQNTAAADLMIEENLQRDPHHLKTHGIKGLFDLQRGRWKEGWQAYELRFKQKNTRQFGGHRQHPVPQWDGRTTEKTVLIWSEQGFGDQIMFARFMHYVLLRAPNAILEVQPHLYELFDQSKIMPQGKLFRLGRQLPAYDFHCALPSTPAILGADEDMMRIDRPYLFADPMLTRNWLGQGNWNSPNHPAPLGAMKMGLCVKGSPNSERPITRDAPVELFIPLAKKFGPFLSLTQEGQFESFADSAAAIMALDLVITVDTSVAHLAGALGIETWLLLSWDPDFRWGLEGERTIWYPSVRIFRQQHFRDWSSVVRRIDDELTRRMRRHDDGDQQGRQQHH